MKREEYHYLLVFILFVVLNIVLWSPVGETFQSFNMAPDCLSCHGQEPLFINCSVCHTIYTGGPGSDGHEAHLSTGISESCHTCHIELGDDPPLANCVKCHLKAGLIEHHNYAAEATPLSKRDTGLCWMCHMPETPAPEGTKPPAFTEVCLNPCDGSEELIWGSYTTSLDNDGDLLVDSMDPDCLNCVTSVVRKIGTPPVDYASLQEAYDFAEGEATLCGNDIAFFEDVSIDAEKSVYFEGGYDCQFGSVVGKSTVIGDLTIYSGTLIIDSGVLELKTTEEVCTDCVDNDSDGLVDCEDSECVGSPLCEVAVPEDHTEEVSGYMHMPGRDDPEANFCTLCHGADLQGDYGPSCNACHFTTHTDDQGSGAMHKPGRQDPVTNLCTICHGIDLNGTILGPSCTACHTADHTEDVGAGIMHKPGKEDPYGTGGCTACHGSDLGGSAIAPSCGSCHGSHTTHLSQTYGPQLTCTNCHGTNAPPMFADGQNLAGTIVCDNCHSVNGVINAKSYWSTPGSSEGIVGSWAATEGYASYCGSCHDGTPGYNGGSAASDVMGDNAGYGFYITGHGLVSGNYPLMYYQEGAGTGNPAAARTCSDCHDLASLHFGSTTKRLMAGYDMDQGNSNCSQCHPPGTVATAAPELYTGSADYEAAGHRTKLCSACHDLHGVISGAYPAMAKEEARALCIACHYAGNPGGLPVPSSPPAEHTDGVTACSSCHNPHKPAHGEAASGDGCIECHGHDSGTLYDPDKQAPYAAGGTASQGRGTYKSHSTHTETDSDDARGPGMYCDGCHDIGNFPYFKSGTDGNGDGKYNLSETNVCDTCHSPGGTYDGINDAVIGAKNNWTGGVYNGNLLPAAKEKWCATCHDESPSQIQTIDAPNVIGDEDAVTNYGIGYGFYTSGHGLAANETYASSGGARSGAGVTCGYCHDTGMKHIDGVARTYIYTAATGNDNDYQHGYRLKSVNGLLPMEMPRVHGCESGVEAADFRLCFSCHDSTAFTSGTNYETNFRHTGTPDFNAHYSHLAIRDSCDYGPVFASDWKSHDNDSRASCVTCHNVHGSPQLSMVRDGQLVSRTGLEVLYYKPGVSFDCFNYPDPGNVSLPESTGTIYTQNTGLCATCHGSCGLDTVYLRNVPPEIIQVQGQVGSDTLSVIFSEGVYTNTGASGNLTETDFALTDDDNGRYIVPGGVAHTAGESVATLTLNQTLDATDDLYSDTLAAATASSIYDSGDAAMDTTPVVISGVGAGSDTLTIHPSGLDSSTDCSPTGGLWADILDSDDGDTTYANCYSYYDEMMSELYPAWFAMAMDDATGLEGATINQLTTRAVVNVTRVSGGVAYVQICYQTGGAGQQCSAFHDLDGTEGYIDIWTGNTADPDGNPLDIDDINNLEITVTLNAEDCCSAADATAHVTEVYAEVAYTLPAADSDPPDIAGQTPANGTTDVNPVSDLTFTLSDGGSGVDWTTFEIQLSGDQGYAEHYTDEDYTVVTKTGFPSHYDVTVNPDADFGEEEVITVTVSVDDFDGNSLVSPVWSFTAGSAPVVLTIPLHPSGVAVSGGFSVSGGTWETILDTNDGDTSYAYYCCSSPGQVFYVHMDDPTGLAGATIQNITIHAYARYKDGPMGVPYSANVDIGFRTGATTEWRGNYLTDTSGDYNHIYSDTYTADSDGGVLDLTDINNLQIAVQRNASGPPQLQVTEVYVEVTYVP